MRASDAVVLTLLGVLGGCVRPPATVSIDLKRVPREAARVVTDLPVPSAAVQGAASAVLPDLPARNVFVGSGEGQAKDAIAMARKNQEKAYNQALAELRETYRAEAASNSRTKAAELQAAYEDKFKVAYAELRKVFEAHAAVVGPLWTRLATLNGFPEKPGRKRAPAEGDFLGKADAKEAAEVKKKISASDSAYRAEVAHRLESLRQAWRADMTELEAARILGLDAADQRAEAEAKHMVRDILRDFERSLIQDIERLPRVAGAQVKLQPVAMPRVQFPPIAESGWSEADRLTRRAGLFARLNGYRLVNPGPGVRDVTKDFLKWDKLHGGR